MLDTSSVKKDFPIFDHNPNLIYLDSASTSLKPRSVIEKMTEYYSQYSANIKRGIYKISEQATSEYEKSRQIVAKFIGVKPEEVIFTRSTTESLNLVAYSLGRMIVEKGDEVVTTIMEHHSNFVPWQQLAFETGADFKVIDIDGEGRLAGAPQVEGVVTKKTKILAIMHVSNVLGTLNPIPEIAKAARAINPNIVIVLDAAQSVGHMKIDVAQLDVDFVAFSGHKMLGPTGIGILWGKKHLLEDMYPFQYGGEMIERVSLEETIFAPIPEKFEAGTPAIAEAIALSAAVEYLSRVGLDGVQKHEQELSAYARKTLSDEFGSEMTIYGPSDTRGGVVAFNLKGIHPHDIAQILDESSIAIRAGHHCAMPLHNRIKVAATARASFYLYNTKEDVDALTKALHNVRETL